MTQTRSSVLTGAFVLGAFLLLTVGILAFGGRALTERKVPAVIYFDENLAGLQVGSPVTFRGVQIGEVTRISILFDNGDVSAQVPVEVELTPDKVTFTDGSALQMDRREVDRLIRAGLRAQLANVSFVTGQKRIDLLFKPEDPPRLLGLGGSRFEIPAVGSVAGNLQQQVADLRIQELAETTEATLVSIKTLAENLNRVAPPLAESALATSDQARETLKVAQGAALTLDTEGAATLVSVRQLSEEGRAQLSDRGEELSYVLLSAGSAAERLDSASQQLEDLARPGAPLRSDLEATARDLADTASSLRGFSREIEENPSALLLGRRR